MLLSDLEELENIIDDIVVELEEENYDSDDDTDDADSTEDLKSLFDTDEVINDCLQIIRPYNLERIDIIKNVNSILKSYTIY